MGGIDVGRGRRCVGTRLRRRPRATRQKFDVARPRPTQLLHLRLNLPLGGYEDTARPDFPDLPDSARAREMSNAVLCMAR